MTVPFNIDSESVLYLVSLSFSGSAGSVGLEGGSVVPRGALKMFAEDFPGMAAMMKPISIDALTILDIVCSNESVFD